MRSVQCPLCEARLQIPTPNPAERVTCSQCKFQFLPPPGPPVPPAPPSAPPVPRARVVRRPAPAPLTLDDDPPESGHGRTLLVLGLFGALVLMLSVGGVAAWWLTRTPNRPVAEDGPRVAPVQASNPWRGDDPAVGPLTGEQVNLRLLKSTVFVIHGDKSGYVACGSGSLVHKARRLVLTNYHVVTDRQQVSVYFPAFGREGEVITDPAHYSKNAATLRIGGKVVARDPRVDLALVELEQVPDAAVGLPLAAKPAATGTTVFSVGGSGVNLANFSGAFWRLSTGTVRGRHRDKITFKNGQTVDAMFLETQKPSNPGDSGGPTVNDRAELVAVVSAGDPRADLVELDIDLSEVRSYLTAFAGKNGWAWEDQAPAPSTPAVVPISPEAKEQLSGLVTQSRTGDPDARVDAMRRLGLLKERARTTVPALVELLDDPDERVRRMASATLDQIGPPAKEDLGCVGKALSGTGKFGRLYALRHYATAEKAARDQLAVLHLALDDRDAEIREAAVRAIGFYGPDAKPVVFGSLLARALDPDPPVAAVATRVLTAFGPYDGAELKVLIDNLRGPSWGLRYLSVLHLTAAAPDAATALGWFEPRLADDTAEVRAVALPAVAKWGPAAKKVLPAAVALTRDDDVRVRTAAVRAVGDIGGGPGAVAALGRFLDPDTATGLRELAARMLLKVEMTEPATDVPVLATLIKVDDPTAKAAVLAKLAKLGPAAVKELLPVVTECLKHPNPVVQLNALKAAAELGPDGIALAPQVVELLAGASREGVLATQQPQPAAPAGPLSGEQLADRLRKSAAWVVVERFGRPVGSTSATLIDVAERLVLTNYHAVASGNSFTVCFPVQEGGELKTSPAFYANNLPRLAKTRYAVTGRLHSSAPQADLAIVQLDSAPPAGVIALPLARDPVGPGQSLHTVGASGVNLVRMDGALWRYTQGRVQNVYDLQANLDGVQPVSCRVLETDVPIPRGDGGSAVANDRGELVGVNTVTSSTKRGLGFAIELGTIRGFTTGAPDPGRPAAGGDAPAVTPAQDAADPIQLQAVTTLSRFGPTTASVLAKALENKLARDVHVRICEILAERGPAVPATAVPYIIQAADRDPTLRPALAAVLVKVGGEEVVKGLKERTAWFYRTVGGKKEKATKYPADLQIWATQTLGKIDPKPLSEKERTALRERLEGLSNYHPDDAVRKEAEAALAKLLAAGLRSDKKP